MKPQVQNQSQISCSFMEATCNLCTSLAPLKNQKKYLELSKPLYAVAERP